MSRPSSLAHVFIAMLGVSTLALAGCTGDAGDEDAEPLVTSSEAISGTTCSPERAEGAVHRYQKALHDSIAYAEGTEGRGKDGYNVGFAYRMFSSCARHPNMRTCSGSLCSTAAGRYQFLKRTWDSTARAIGSSSFEPDNQEKGAQYLITKVRRVTIPSTRALSATEFSNAMKKLSWEWASLPPGRYGQPNRTQAAMRTDYCRNLGGC